MIYPRCSPDLQNDDLKRIQALLPTVEPGEGRSFEMQAVYQLIGLVVTLSIALIAGSLTGKLMVLVNEKFIETEFYIYDVMVGEKVTKRNSF